MKEAIDRVTKTVRDYRTGSLSRALATIELVSAFKVVGRSNEADADKLQKSVSSFIDAILNRLDNGDVSTEAAIAELARVYEASFNHDPDIMRYIAEYE